MVVKSILFTYIRGSNGHENIEREAVLKQEIVIYIRFFFWFVHVFINYNRRTTYYDLRFSISTVEKSRKKVSFSGRDVKHGYWDLHISSICFLYNIVLDKNTSSMLKNKQFFAGFHFRRNKTCRVCYAVLCALDIWLKVCYWKGTIRSSWWYCAQTSLRWRY